jgi:hypothetical protein
MRPLVLTQKLSVIHSQIWIPSLLTLMLEDQRVVAAIWYAIPGYERDVGDFNIRREFGFLRRLFGELNGDRIGLLGNLVTFFVADSLHDGPSLYIHLRLCAHGFPPEKVLEKR